MQIQVENLRKTYRIPKRNPGLKNAFKSLFSKEYEEVHALEGVSFNINEGELVGYIGPNGAGKSTTVKVMSGILVPDSGTCTVQGRVPWKDRINHVRDIGVVFGQRTQLWWDLPVIESFELLKDIYSVPYDKYKKNKDELIEWLDLSSFMNTPVRQLSLGQRMRCELAASLLHSPKILFLDEPTIGLDAVSKLAVREFIKKLNRERKVTVILTTHDMDDIEALCSRIMIIGKGKILLDGTIDDLRNAVSKERKLIVHHENKEFKFHMNNVELIERNINCKEINFNPEIIPPSDLISIISKENKVKDLLIENSDIEEIIAKLYGDM